MSPDLLSARPLLEPCDRIVFATSDVVAGDFRCPPSYPDFVHAGRINYYLVAFPRSAVWIQRTHVRRFVADPGTATIYNPGQAYARYPISPEGDNSNWLGVSESFARDVVGQFSQAHAEQVEPFHYVRASVANDVYFAQHQFFADVSRGHLDALEAEERALAIVSAVVASAYQAPRGSFVAPRRGRSRQDLVEDAKAAISAKLFENLSVGELAGSVGVSPFHLCRAFRGASGMTLNDYRRVIRLRAVLGLTRDYRGNLSALALRAGFYSHSHFSTAFRRAFGVPPSAQLPA